jgi:hypothetical protein
MLFGGRAKQEKTNVKRKHILRWTRAYFTATDQSNPNLIIEIIMLFGGRGKSRKNKCWTKPYFKLNESVFYDREPAPSKSYYRDKRGYQLKS